MLTTARALRKMETRLKMSWAGSGADAFLVSYPKSGRTWFRHILSDYFSRTANDGKVDLFRMFEVLPNFDLDPQRGIPAFRYAAERARVPLILVSHLAYRRTLFFRRPVVFMVRDPRDVIVSAYFHATRHKHRFEGDMDAFIRDDQQGLPALIAYLNSWARGLAHHRHAVLSYEELTEDPVGTSSRILRFLGHVPSVTELEQAVEASRFEAMREHEVARGLPAHVYDRGDTESRRMRRGKVGGFADYLSDAQAELIERTCSERLTIAAKALLDRGTGFFPYN
jgi:alcohol sulfotransferase